MPYIYSLGLESALTATPPQRWIGWGYESDPEVWTKALKAGEEQYWFGDTLLVGGVYQPGLDAARLYLPRQSSADGFDYGYVNLSAPYDHLASGQWATISSPWRESIPLLAKIGGAIPVGKSVQTRMPGDESAESKALPVDDYRGIEIFPPKGSSHGQTFSTTWYEDNGLSLTPDISKFTITYSANEEKVIIDLTPSPDNVFVPPWRDVVIILPVGDERYVESANGHATERLATQSCERVRYKMAVPVPRSQSVCNGYH